MTLPIVHDERYVTDLPDGHRFPMAKFELVFERACESIGGNHLDIHSPIDDPLPWIRDVHDESYVEDFLSGSLPDDHQREIGLPWSEGLVERTITAVGGTMRTIDLALEHGLACNTAGGTHHAFSNRGSGFCILNDLAVGAYRALSVHSIETILILDLDVHQGNGTAKFVETENNISTLSVHCESNYPFNETDSDRDIGIHDGIEDDSYLEILRENLPSALDEENPDLVLYDAGVDVHRNDRLGNLNLSDDGIRQRDRFVLELFQKREIPTACVIGGGYDEDLEELAKRHAILHETASTLSASPVFK